jgi:UDP:flavonoid glycosyltransferase YjiC (YdhE family)
VLFSCVHGEGHFNPLLPLALAFADAGHAVAFATASSAEERVRRAGLAFLPVGIDGAERDARFEPFRAEHRALPLAERRAFLFPRIFGTIEAPARIAPLRAALDAWRPDLVLYDSADLAAPLAAAERSLPTVNHAFGRLVPPPILEAAAARAVALWREAGLEPDRYGGLFRGIYLDVSPPSLRLDEVPDGARVEALRPVAVTADGEPAPPWLAALPARPTVYVTLGTIWNSLAVFRVLLDGLADLDCNVVVTIGRDGDPAALERVPANARVERYVPQALLLPHCAAVVTHGGSGSMLAALAHGLPLLLVPQGADQLDNAESCAAAGAGLVLLPDELSAARVRDAAATVLVDERYGRRAREVAAEIEAMPAPDEVVTRLAAAL